MSEDEPTALRLPRTLVFGLYWRKRKKNFSSSFFFFRIKCKVAASLSSRTLLAASTSGQTSGLTSLTWRELVQLLAVFYPV